jgi:outer membrane protein assembly factor BamB
VFVFTDSNNLVALDITTGEMKWVPVAVSATAVRAAPSCFAQW